jgi:N-carbamoyl-L-amino-acid hydrolase
MRALAAGPRPARPVRLVDWADEEGARFGRSLFGSSAAAGLLQTDELAHVTDADGVALPAALAAHGVSLEHAPRAQRRLRDVGGYVELHIEQGPALEDAGLSLGVVDAVFGLRRHLVRIDGRAAHAGSTPMRLRRDPLAAASRLVLAARTGAIDHGGVATVGRLSTEPGTPTAVAERVELVLDQRHRDADALSRMVDDIRVRMDVIAAEEQTPVEWLVMQEVAPVSFDPGLVEIARECVEAVAGACTVLPSGALHDAVMVARAGVPAVMLFVQSIGGVSHSRIEDSHPQHIEQGVAALDLVVRRLV